MLTWAVLTDLDWMDNSKEHVSVSSADFLYSAMTWNHNVDLDTMNALGIILSF